MDCNRWGTVMTLSHKVCCISHHLTVLCIYVLFSVQESNEDKKLSASCENLLEANASKVQMFNDHNLGLFLFVLLLIILILTCECFICFRRSREDLQGSSKSPPNQLRARSLLRWTNKLILFCFLLVMCMITACLVVCESSHWHFYDNHTAVKLLSTS